MTKKKQLRIEKRLISHRRHAVGYLINGKKYTRRQAIDLAKKGRIADVKVVKGRSYSYLVGCGFKLSDLESEVVKVRTILA